MSTLELPVIPPSNHKIRKTNQLHFLKKLLEKIIKKDIAAEFFTIIPKENVKNPMDFKTVQLRLNNYFYGGGRECIKDIHLVFSNASKDIESSKSTIDNAKKLENIFYAELEALPKPEIDLISTSSDRGSKSSKVMKKRKKSPETLNVKGKKLGNDRTSKMMEALKLKPDQNSEKKTKTSNKSDNVAVKNIKEPVDKTLVNLNKLSLPLDYIDHLKLYDNLLKVRSMNKKFQHKYSAVKQKKKAQKTLSTPIPKASTSKKPKEEKHVIPSSSRIETSSSKQKDGPVNPKSSLTLPNVNRLGIQKPMDLDALLGSERFRPLPKKPIVTEERKKQRDLQQQNRKNLGGKANFCLAADIMQAFEMEHKFYPYNDKERNVPSKNSVQAG